jgi:hypothetical protein
VGLLGWFKSAPKTLRVEDDRVWMTPEAKYRGVAEDLEAQLPHSAMLLAVAHFPATLAQIKAEVEHYRFTPVVHDQALSAAEVRRLADQNGAPPIVLVLAERLIVDEFPEPPSDHAKPVTLLVGERHFLRANDEKIVAFARGLGRHCRLAFHVPIRDPLMQAFAGEWIGDMLTNLGANETDAIESRLITRRIQGAQAKFVTSGAEERKADSAEQWLELNASGPVAR